MQIYDGIFLRLQWEPFSYFTTFSFPSQFRPSSLVCFHFWMVTESGSTMKTIATITRSSCPQIFYKIGALKNFAKFAEKQLCRDFFVNKGAG